MEKKKLLLVSISVGIFLVIAIGAALLFFAPKKPAAPSVAVTNPGSGTSITVPPPSSNLPTLSDVDSPVPGNSQPAGVDAVELVRKPGDVPGLKAPPEGTIRQGTDFYVNGNPQNNETVISVPKPTAAAVPSAAPESKAVPAPAPKITEAAPKPAAPAVSKPAAPAASKSKAPVQTKAYDDYWVQTGAFSTVASAQGVKETLATKGITSIIENREVDGKTLFRVRVGPYTSQNEADYWLSLIKAIGGFEDSQVRLTQSRR